MSKRLTFSAEAKIINAAERRAQYVASNQALDCYNEIVRAAGWQFDRFVRNAPFVDSHDYSSIIRLLGNVTAWKVQGDSLIEDVQFVPEGISAFADFAWKMTETGFLRAVSVGFMPVRVRSRWRDEKDFAEACSELRLTAEQAARVQCIHWEQSQTELSAVLIGANPDAVALAHKSGAVRDEDLASVGFADDDLTFLHEAAPLFAGENRSNAAFATARREVRRALDAIITRKLSATPPPETPTAKTARAAAAGERTRDRAKAVAALRDALAGNHDNER